MISFFIVIKTSIFYVKKSVRSKTPSFWQAIVRFRVVHCAKVLYIVCQIDLIYKSMIVTWLLFDEDSSTATCLNLTPSNKPLIDTVDV